MEAWKYWSHLFHTWFSTRCICWIVACSLLISITCLRRMSSRDITKIMLLSFSLTANQIWCLWGTTTAHSNLFVVGNAKLLIISWKIGLFSCSRISRAVGRSNGFCFQHLHMSRVMETRSCVAAGTSRHTGRWPDRTCYRQPKKLIISSSY